MLRCSCRRRLQDLLNALQASSQTMKQRTNNRNAQTTTAAMTMCRGSKPYTVNSCAPSDDKQGRATDDDDVGGTGSVPFFICSSQMNVVAL